MIAALFFVAAVMTDPAPQAPHRGGNFASYISDTDYPAEAIRRGEEGIVGFTIEVSPQGRVAACSVTVSSGSAALDAATCRLLAERARFIPARNDRGEAVSDIVNGRIRWQLPD